MANMFYKCNSLTSIDVSSFDTGKVTDMSGMFSTCGNLTTITASEVWSTEAVTNSDLMFYNDTKLIGGEGTAFDAEHVDAEYARIDGGNNNPGYMTVALPIYGYATLYNGKLTFYYDRKRQTRAGTAFPLNNGTSAVFWRNEVAEVTAVVFDFSFSRYFPTTTYSWFYDMTNLKTIEGWKNLNTDSVANMRMMFGNCSSLEEIDLSNFNTQKVTNMRQMFLNCSGMKSIDVSNFDTQNVTNMMAMFSGCSNLEEIDVSNFDTKSVINMNQMFFSCSSLTSLDLSKFDTHNVKDMTNMFADCENLTTIYAGNDWSTENVENGDGMFSSCEKLIGGKGTRYDMAHVGVEYAHIDGGPSNPGYFSQVIRYDLNGDGKVSTADIQVIINEMKKAQASQNMAYDLNGDGKISTADIQVIINEMKK